jgi:hypothetical protein
VLTDAGRQFLQLLFGEAATELSDSSIKSTDSSRNSRMVTPPVKAVRAGMAWTGSGEEPPEQEAAT